MEQMERNQVRARDPERLDPPMASILNPPARFAVPRGYSKLVVSDCFEGGVQWTSDGELSVQGVATAPGANAGD